MPNVYLHHVVGDQLLWVSKYAPRGWRQRARHRPIKRATDLLVVFGAIPLWVPVSLLTALLIKIESPREPVFYVQKRTGKDGRQFHMLKFRTMRIGADKMLAELQHLNSRRGGDIKIENDPRITRVGKWLRASKIDELPQFVNVLQGNMSLVGPRPTSYGPENFSAWHSERFEAVPGITGLWQLYQDCVTDLDDKVRLDIALQERQCVQLEVRLLLATAFRPFLRIGKMTSRLPVDIVSRRAASRNRSFSDPL
jgi:lipopolysaccharide/colanic/teichoic acid biosynthesis glycosyltransferase